MAGDGGKTGTWVVDAKNGNGAVRVAKDGEFLIVKLTCYQWKYLNISAGDKGDVTISMKDDDLVQLLAGKLHAQQAYFQGRLKVQGNMGLAMKLQELTKNAAVPKAKL